MPLYAITAHGASHRRSENGVIITYRSAPRGPGERSEIELTEAQAKSPSFSHLGLKGPLLRRNIEVTKTEPVKVEGTFDHDSDGKPGGSLPAFDRIDAVLLAEAEALNVKIDKRWGEARIRKEIAKAK